jgi:hypothetical protein
LGTVRSSGRRNIDARTRFRRAITRPRGPRSIGVLPTLAEDLLDVVGRPYDGVDYVVLDDVRETEGSSPTLTLVFEDKKTADECASAMKHIFDSALGIRGRV